MGTVLIGGVTFEIYSTFTLANDYMKGQTDASAWSAADTTAKNQALVTATRSFDRQTWVGTPTDLATPQPIAWPRTGVTDRNGQAVPDSVIPQDVLNGFYEWALDIVGDVDIASQSPGTNTKRVRTKEKVDVIEVEAETELFRATIGQTARFPIDIMEWISIYLSGSGDAGLAFASGTGVTSGFTTDDTDFGFTPNGLDGGSVA
jgi:hypothetical protein